MFYARWTRKGVPAATSFVDRLQPYVAEWASAAHELNVVTEHRLHDAAAIGQCCSWGPQEHRGTYERILAVAMRYSAVVNYTGTVEIPLLPRHPASSSSSASTAASLPMPATFADGISASRVQRHPQAQGPHTYVQ
jgi:hypothetical protein